MSVDLLSSAMYNGIGPNLLGKEASWGQDSFPYAFFSL